MMDLMRHRNALLNCLVVFVFCGIVGANEISDEEMAVIYGKGYSGEMCGYCYDMCGSWGDIDACEALGELGDCYRQYPDAGGTFCAALYSAANGTPGDSIFYCHASLSGGKINCTTTGSGVKYCGDITICNCNAAYPPDYGRCEVVPMGRVSDNDNCIP